MAYRNPCPCRCLPSWISAGLQITQAQLLEISYAPEHSQETSNAQAQQQETSNQIELQKSLFEFEHLISNQWCSQYKSDTDSYDSRISKIWTLIRNSKWSFDAEQFQESFGACKLLLSLFNSLSLHSFI